MKKLILSLLVALSLSIGSSAQAGKAKKLGKISARGLEIAAAVVVAGNMRSVGRRGYDGNYSILAKTQKGIQLGSALYLLLDGCKGIYKELKTWNEANEIKARG